MQAIYIHIPFCNQICSYCDFTKMYYKEDQVNDYLLQLEKEIKSKYQNEIVKTIYIGGGTPSSLNLKQLLKLIKIISLFKKSKDCEITLECNIDVDLEKLKLLKPYINRLSIGVQSFNKKILTYLNRDTDIDIEDKIKEIKKLGYKNINIDLMYAIPIENIKILKNDLENIIKLDINHISTYSLILEPHTKLYIDSVQPIDEDTDFKMYKLIIKTLEKNNFVHYEISNFCKEGYQSKHNLTYWNNEEYYGFGLGASGYINNIRYTNTKSLKEYLKSKYIYEKETLHIQDKMSYEMILGLRKIEGISLIEFKKKYNIDVRECFNLEELIKNKKIIIKQDRLFINKKYLYTSNDILINFLRSDVNGKM